MAKYTIEINEEYDKYLVLLAATNGVTPEQVVQLMTEANLRVGLALALHPERVESTQQFMEFVAPGSKASLDRRIASLMESNQKDRPNGD